MKSLGKTTDSSNFKETDSDFDSGHYPGLLSSFTILTCKLLKLCHVKIKASKTRKKYLKNNDIKKYIHHYVCT